MKVIGIAATRDDLIGFSRATFLLMSGNIRESNADVEWHYACQVFANKDMLSLELVDMLHAK